MACKFEVLSGGERHGIAGAIKLVRQICNRATGDALHLGIKMNGVGDCIPLGCECDILTLYRRRGLRCICRQIVRIVCLVFGHPTGELIAGTGRGIR